MTNRRIIKGWSFKRQKAETGLAAVGNPHPTVWIKHNGKIVGEIIPPNWKERNWRFGFMLAEKGDNWEWRFWKVGSQFTEEEIREYIRNSGDRYLGLGLYYSDEW